jgi:hypothetical protein
MDLKTRFEFLAGAVKEFFSLRHHVQTDSGVHPNFYIMDTVDSFPGNNEAGA